MTQFEHAVRDALKALEDRLAETIVTRQWKLQPDLERRYGPAGRAKCVEDAHYHLKYLIEAVSASEPELFADYIEWARVMLGSRKIPLEDLRIHLEILRDVVATSLPDGLQDTARDCVNAALENLRPHRSETTVLDGEKPFIGMARSYLSSLLRFERHEATKIILGAVEAGMSVRDIYCHVFEPCQREIGRLWQVNAITVAQEHYCTASAQSIMALLYPLIFSEKKARIGKVVAACVPGELHELGPRMLCDLLELEAWDTVYLGANVPLASLLHTIKTLKPQVVAISATMTFHLDAVRRVISALRESMRKQPFKIFVGGHAFHGSSELWRAVGADGFAKDAADSMTLFRRLQL